MTEPDPVRGLVGVTAVLRHAGLPVTTFRMPDQRVAACSVLRGPLAPEGGEDDFFRDRAEDTGRRLRLLTVRDPDAGEHDGAGGAVVRDFSPALVQSPLHGEIGRVQLLGPVQREHPVDHASHLRELTGIRSSHPRRNA